MQQIQLLHSNFSRACCDRTRGNSFKLRGEIQTGYKEEIFYHEGGETLGQVAQRGGRCPIPGQTEGQAGQGSEHPDPAEDVPGSLLGGWTRWPLKVPSSPKHSVIQQSIV